MGTPATIGGDCSKSEKYHRALVPALEELGWTVQLVTMGVGALGTIPRSMKDALVSICQFSVSEFKPAARDYHACHLTLSKIAIACSYAVFRERENVHWVTPGPLNLLTI